MSTSYVGLSRTLDRMSRSVIELRNLAGLCEAENVVDERVGRCARPTEFAKSANIHPIQNGWPAVATLRRPVRRAWPHSIYPTKTR